MRRVVVVGGGVIGLLTALECVLAGADVTVVEQSSLPNVDGASYDRHRVVRALHPNDPGATGAALTAQRRWAQLEQLLGTRLWHRTGAIAVRPTEEIAAHLDLLATAGLPAYALSAAELSQRYPHVKVPTAMAAVVEPGAGVVLADVAMAALVAWLHRRPDARLVLRRRVVTVDPGAGAVELDDGAVLCGDAIVVAAGPWSRDLLPGSEAARLRLHRQSMLYCEPPRELRHGWAASPAIHVATADGPWLVPPVAGTPLKLSAHSASRAVDELDGHDTSPQRHDHLVAVFRDLLVGFEPSWVVDSRDGYFLADGGTGGPLLIELAEGEVWVYAACGGSSFKFAPLIGRSLAARAMGTDAALTGLDAIDRPVCARTAYQPAPPPNHSKSMLDATGRLAIEREKERL